MLTKEKNLSKTDWSTRYGKAHQLIRIENFPEGISPPKKVRVYRRREHYVLQAWDPSQKKTISDRVDGDFLAALTRAREIDQRILAYRRSGVASRQLRHSDLVDQYLDHMTLRANAGEVDETTVGRYASSLQHYLCFAQQHETSSKYLYVGRVDRAFALRFRGFLNNRLVARNGRSGAKTGFMTGQRYVLSVVRAMFSWAASPASGPLLGEEFMNPFLSLDRLGVARAAIDMTRDLSVSKAMAESFLQETDEWQYPLFCGYVLFGWRAAEPAFIFREDLSLPFMNVRCYPELAYFTKGRRDKRFPMLAEFKSLQEMWRRGGSEGLLFRRRHTTHHECSSLACMVARFEQECRRSPGLSANQKRKVRQMVFREAGSLHYDLIENEFRGLAKRLQWPSSATLRSFRHLFSTVLENAGMPEYYRRFFMGQSVGRAAIVTYTHLDQLTDRYREAFQREWPSLFPLIEKLAARHIAHPVAL